MVVQGMAELRKRYRAEREPERFRALPEMSDAGLTLGRGTLLAPLGSERNGEAGERMAVLLAAVYGRPVTPLVTKAFARAAGHWRRGDGALAHIELAFARLPRLESEDDAFRLFLAESLLAEAMTPRALARALGFEADLSKYAPDQPRVPAGSGRESGQWTSDAVDQKSTHSSPAESLRSKLPILTISTKGPFQPGGTVAVPTEEDPLDPQRLNAPPTPQEQQSIADTLNTIKIGSTEDIEKLGPHAYKNYPHPRTGATLPPSATGYTSYTVPLGSRGRGLARLIIERGSGLTYYTNTHYLSFYRLKIGP